MSGGTYKLSETLTGHEEDVRGIRFLSPSTIISCSRDATVRIWKKGSAEAKPEPGEAEEGTESHKTATSTFSGTVNSNAHAFVNSIGFFTPSADHPNGLIASGGQDGLIDVREPGSAKDDADYLLVGHAGNVCAIDIKDDIMISGSWDKTAIVWKNWGKKYHLQGHDAAVWAVLVISENEFLTGSADKKIRWWQGEKQIRSVEAHPEPVRGLCRLPHGGFASCGNDGTIRTWTLDGNAIDTIYGHTAFIYSIAALPTGEIVSSGEDRTLKVWKGTACVQTITHPAISVWCVSVCEENGDIVSGASDRLIRVFSKDQSRWADEETLKAFDEVVAGSAIPEQQVGQINKEKLPGTEALRRPGKHDGETIMINGGENVEAYRWSSSETTWHQVGVVTGSVSTGRKQSYQGKDYDYVFDVDFEEGKPPLKLPYNINQNPFDAARMFLERYELPMTYLETTANFIISNTGGAASIGTTSGASDNDPLGTESRYRPGESQFGGGVPSQPAAPPKPASVLPQSSFLDITTANLDVINRKVLELNANLISSGEKDLSLNPEEVSSLDMLIKFLRKPSAPSSASAKSSQAVLGGLDVITKIVKGWQGTAKMPGLDLLRLLARFSPAVALYNDDGQSIVDVLKAGGAFDESTPNNVMLGTRTFVNMFSTLDGLKYVDQEYENIQSLLAPLATQSSNRGIRIAYTTLVLNYSVRFFKTKADERATNLLETLATLLTAETDPEALYRCLVAVGTAIQAGDLAKQSAKEIYNVLPLVKQTAEKVRSTEKRITSVVKELEQLLK